MLIMVCLISLLIALPGFIHKAGYSLWKGLIPFYNIYLFFRLIEFPMIVLLLFSILFILLPDRVFILTLLVILLPFMVGDAYGKSKFSGVLTLFLPFIMYPYLAYFNGVYCYDVIDHHKSYFMRHKVFTAILIGLSFYIYSNYTMLVDENKLVDKSNYHYVNELYMSDGLIYNNYLTDLEKKMYDVLFDNAKKYRNNIDFDMNEFLCSDDCYKCGDLINKAHYALLVDHPELINYSGYSWKYYDGDFDLRLDFSVNNYFKSYIGETRIKRIISKIKKETNNMSDLEKIKYVYEWIGENNTYDHLFTFSSKNQSIYNVFMNNNAVCSGFAKASQVIFQNIGIDSKIMIGMAGELHMWNLVEVDGKWYFFDSTVATGRREESSSYYDGLIQEKMNYYEVYNKEWYPKYEIGNGLYTK